MENQDRQAIEGLFARLGEVARQAGPRDAEAEAFISERVAQQPGAPYFMAQTIVMQKYALEQAEERIAELERRRPAGGMFGGLFGSQDSRPAAPAFRQGSAPNYRAPFPAQQAGGGGFLAGAAQTAMGVAGGLLLGNAIAGLFSGDEAHAAEDSSGDGGESVAGDGGGDDGGGFFDFGGE